MTDTWSIRSVKAPSGVLLVLTIASPKRNSVQKLSVALAPSQDSTRSSASRTEVGESQPTRTTTNQAPDANSSFDEGGDVPVPRQGRIGGTPSLDAPNSILATTAPKKSSGNRRKVTSKNSSGSESEPSLIEGAAPIKSSQIQLPSRPRNVAPTPRSSKRTKSVPGRPRLSDFIPAPAATSDIEPDEDSLGWAGNTSSSSSELLVFPASTYTIQLILDEREVKSMKNRDYILKGLQKRGVAAEKRALEIGDVCWVARSKEPVDESRAECVLDYIVERKRMDDLRSSILDGRFHEQKEDYDTERIARQWREQINTALSSTQVIDRFFLKETTSIEDTLDYLSGLHKTISMLHKEKALYIIPPQLVKRH
ncbi:Crossover junction endonuclease mus81, partial [Ceratobasidium sp. 370]